MEEINNTEQFGTNKHNVAILNFEGPLDLLCHLVSKNKKDIFEISLSELTDKYLEYLDSMAELNMEIATEFLVMAATLLYIKSKKLLPTLEEDEQTEQEVSEEKLIQKIALYKMYKDKQELFRQLYKDNFGKFEKMPEKIKFDKKLFVSNYISSKSLLQSYSEICNRNNEKINKKAEEIEKIAMYEKVTVKSKVRLILNQLRTKSKVIFNSLFNSKNSNKIDIVTAFLGMLELSRLKQVKLSQKGLYEQIEIQKIGENNFDISLLKE